jgi:shikimate dehydrogenase
MNKMTDRYAVIGNPIEHSKSPLIHAAFARQTGQWMEYGQILGRNFEQDVADFFELGGQGLNVTVPFKEQAWVLANERSLRAERAGAVNTFKRLTDGRLFGDNTDGVGLVRDLTQNHGVAVHEKRILLLGAGGAARGVLLPLLQEHPASLSLANRTRSKATILAELFADDGVISPCGLNELNGRVFDLIINATAAGLLGETPDLPDHCLAEGGVTYDMMYGDQPTRFVRWGLSHGAAKALDGLGMLVEQAAESFFLWRGIRPETHSVIGQLRPGTDNFL